MGNTDTSIPILVSVVFPSLHLEENFCYEYIMVRKFAHQKILSVKHGNAHALLGGILSTKLIVDILG